MSSLSSIWRRKPKRQEVCLNLAQASSSARAAKEKIRRNKGARINGNWIRPAIGFLVFVEVLLLGGHAIRWARRSRHFELSKVVIAGHQALQPEDVVRLAALEPGSNIFDADLEAVRMRVTSHPWVERAHVRMRPPHFVHIDIIERKPAALLSGYRPVVVDAYGVVLGRPMMPLGKCLPLIEGFASGDLRPGDLVRKAGFARSMKAAFTFQDVPVIRSGCVSVRNAGAGHLRLRALGGRVELMVSGERMKGQASRLRAIAREVLRREQFRMGGLRLDLRFPGRVIVRPFIKDEGGRG